MARLARSPEHLGKRLWARAARCGTAEPLSVEGFEAALSSALSLSVADPTRLHYCWHALVALAPGSAELQRCLAVAPAGFSPVLQHSNAGVSVLGSDAAWRVAYIGYLKGASTASTVLATLVPNASRLPARTTTLSTLSRELELLDATLSWRGLIEHVADWDRASLPWQDVFMEIQDAPEAALATAWRHLLGHSDALQHALSLRRAGAPGTLCELMDAVPALALA